MTIEEIEALEELHTTLEAAMQRAEAGAANKQDFQLIRNQLGLSWDL